MKVNVIAIGDELLFGQTIDTNSAWIAAELGPHGIEVSRRYVVGDQKKEIIYALDESLKNADMVLITGGLGPTDDDLTRDVLCDYFDSELRRDEEILSEIEIFFTSRNRPITERNRMQADVPVKCTPLHNKLGTAPGMLFDIDGKIVISMPGVPYEMKAMVQNDIVPLIQKRFDIPKVEHRWVCTLGIGESFLADHLLEFEKGLPSGIKMAYLPSRYLVRLRLSSNSTHTQEITRQHEMLQNLCTEWSYANDNLGMEEVIGKLFKENGLSISTAESCTGGYIAHQLSRHPGSSAFYNGTVVSYSNEVKMKALGVSEQVLIDQGAVCEEVVLQMVEGVCKMTASDAGIAVSGIAGPDGGIEDKPVGTVWIAVKFKDKIKAKLYQFNGSRQQIIESTALISMNGLRKMVLSELG